MEGPRNAGVLDVRSREAYLAHHVVDSGHIPRAELEERVFELPAPQGGPDEPAVHLIVVYDDKVEDVTTFLTSKGYSVTETVEGSKLIERFTASQLESGKNFFCLWRPNPALEKCWNVILEELKDWKGERRLCFDLAAGNGRDCVFAARHGFHSIGVDYQQRQWSKIAALAERAPLEMRDDQLHMWGSVRWSDTDLETPDPMTAIHAVLALSEGRPCALLILSRYLHRPLNPHLWRLVQPGGLILFHTFCDGAQNVGRKTPTRPRFLLQPGELRDVFGEHFDVLDDSVLLLPDKRPTSCFLAKRKPE